MHVQMVYDKRQSKHSDIGLLERLCIYRPIIQANVPGGRALQS